MFGYILKITLLIAGVIGVFVGQKYFNMKDDNIVEQIVEEEIKEVTGISIDLSPEDPTILDTYRELKKN